MQLAPALWNVRSEIKIVLADANLFRLLLNSYTSSADKIPICLAGHAHVLGR
jgi:hypothetical protein